MAACDWQHVVPLDLRRQHRRLLGPFFLSAFLSRLRLRCRFYPYRAECSFSRTNRRGQRRDRRGHGCILSPLSEGEGPYACAADLLLHILVAAVMGHAGLLVRYPVL